MWCVTKWACWNARMNELHSWNVLLSTYNSSNVRSCLGSVWDVVVLSVALISIILSMEKMHSNNDSHIFAPTTSNSSWDWSPLWRFYLSCLFLKKTILVNSFISLYGTKIITCTVMGCKIKITLHDFQSEKGTFSYRQSLSSLSRLKSEIALFENLRRLCCVDKML